MLGLLELLLRLQGQSALILVYRLLRLLNLARQLAWLRLLELALDKRLVELIHRILVHLLHHRACALHLWLLWLLWLHRLLLVRHQDVSHVHDIQRLIRFTADHSLVLD